ncbi:Hypothetical_protein [Hexamita inflata]|uniref:Hypothetical_protein n=1 Tax=Hexamita inflata TaxID=28002 RepID=A0AA86P055_9EUKA|nr:Hypothetical protein HINF_LOCUS17652 [Hexamita inflata]
MNTQQQLDITISIEHNSDLMENFVEVYQNRKKWQLVSWCSFFSLVFSVMGIYFVIYSMSDYYDINECIKLLLCILACTASMVGVLFSIQSCYKVKSVNLICCGQTKLM